MISEKKPHDPPVAKLAIGVLNGRNVSKILFISEELVDKACESSGREYILALLSEITNSRDF